ncbi:hypothetical protein PZA11_007401 [Diplocarpon coronariae]
MLISRDLAHANGDNGIAGLNPPPSTMAAQLINNLSTAGNAPSRHADAGGLQSLMNEVANVETRAAQQLEAEPGFIEDLDVKLERKHKLIYVFARALLERVASDDPFKVLAQLVKQTHEALDLFLATLREIPEVLDYTLSDDERFPGRGSEPLWKWLFPRLLALLGRRGCENLTKKIHSIFCASYDGLAQSPKLWHLSSSIFRYLKDCVQITLSHLEMRGIIPQYQDLNLVIAFDSQGSVTTDGSSELLRSCSYIVRYAGEGLANVSSILLLLVEISKAATASYDATSAFRDYLAWLLDSFLRVLEVRNRWKANIALHESFMMNTAFLISLKDLLSSLRRYIWPVTLRKGYTVLSIICAEIAGAALRQACGLLSPEEIADGIAFDFDSLDILEEFRSLGLQEPHLETNPVDRSGHRVDDGPPSKRRKMNENVVLFGEIAEDISELLGAQRTADLTGLSQVAVHCFEALGEPDRCKAIELLGRLPCAISATLTLTRENNKTTDAKCLTCDGVGLLTPVDAHHNAEVSQEISNEVILTMTKLVQSPAFIDSRRPRILAMFALGRIATHFDSQDLINLDISSLSQWCFLSLKSSMRELRLAAGIVKDDELNIVLLSLVRIAKKADLTVEKLLGSFWSSIATAAVTELLIRPQITQLLADLLGISVAQFLVLTQSYTLPFLVLNGKVDVIKRISEARNDADNFSVCMDPSNLPPILALLLVQNVPDLDSFVMGLLRRVSNEEFKDLDLGSMTRIEPMHQALYLLKAAGQADESKKSRVALEHRELQASAFSAWDSMLRNLGDEDVETMLESTFAIIIQHWQRFDDMTQKRAEETLQYLLHARGRLIRNMIVSLPSLSAFPQLAIVERKISKLRTPTDVGNGFQIFRRRLAHEDPGVVAQSLVELKAYLRLNQSFLQASAVSDQPNIVVGQLVRSILDTCVKYNEWQNDIAALSAECLGLIGCLDPNRVESVRGLREMVVVSNFHDQAESTESFTLDLLQKPFHMCTDLIFPPLCRAIRIKDVSVASFILPYLVLHVIIDGTDTHREEIGAELLSILEYECPAESQIRREDMKSCIETVFRILDYLARWMQEKQIKSSSRGQIAPDAERDIFLVKSVVEIIPPELISRRAIQCESYSRALFYWEQYMRDSRSRGTDPDRTLHLQRLQDIYTQIDEPDGIEGISAHLHVLDIDQQIICHRKAGRWTAAQSWYEIQLAENPEDINIHLEFTKHDIASAWLTSARLARKGNAIHQSFNAVLHASQLGDQSAMIEHARLLWKEGHHRKAIQSLQGAIADNAFVSHNKKFQATSFTGPDREKPDQQNLLTARAHLLNAKWLDSAGQTQSLTLRTQYQLAAKTHVAWEKGHYYLGRHYNKLLESEKTLPPDRQNETLLTGETAKLVIENYLRALTYGTKYLYQTLPRILTLWLDLGTQVQQPIDPKYGSGKEFVTRITNLRRSHLDQIHARFNKYINRLPAYMYYTALPQIVARIAHPNLEVYKYVQNMIFKVVSTYPQQALWCLLAVCTSNQTDRRMRGGTILQGLRVLKKSEISVDMKTLIRNGEKVTEQLLLACNAGDFQGNRTSIASLSKDLGFITKHCIPSQLAVPVESVLTATLPTLTDNIRGHRAFSRDIVTLDSFSDEVLVLSSLQKPRKLTARGSDGKNYGLMCKPKDDLRKDQRLMEFNSMINRSLKRDAESSRRQLYIKTYAVTPLNEECGLIEWVDGLKTLRDILLGLYKSIGISPNYNEIAIFCEEATKSEDKLPFFTEKVLGNFPPIFHRWFVAQFPEPSAWLAARLRYTRSCAVMSMVGTILGLGDRHGENILFEEGNGGTFHVDFNCLFDKGLTFVKPERVPFRLTHNMIDAMGMYGYEGPFRKSSELTLKLLRQHEETLMTILEAFVHDPTLDLLTTNAKKKKKDGVPQTAQGVLDSIQRKVQGLLPGESVPLGVEGQVDELIKLATNQSHLAGMYIGWCSFF